MVRLSVKPLMVGAFLAGFSMEARGWPRCGLRSPYGALHQPRGKAVPSEDFRTPSDEQIQLLRKDIRAQRKQLIAANMKFSGAEREILAHL